MYHVPYLVTKYCALSSCQDKNHACSRSHLCSVVYSWFLYQPEKRAVYAKNPIHTWKRKTRIVSHTLPFKVKDIFGLPKSVKSYTAINDNITNHVTWIRTCVSLELERKFKINEKEINIQLFLPPSKTENYKKNIYWRFRPIHYMSLTWSILLGF